MTVVHTIGYEGRDLDDLVTALKQADVALLADVRAVPASRKKGFSKSALRSGLEAAGIAYRHIVALGNPKPGRDAARAGRTAEYRSIYLAHLDGAEARAAFADLTRIVRDCPTCLLCYERAPERCHRAILADRLGAKGIDVVHL